MPEQGQKNELTALCQALIQRKSDSGEEQAVAAYSKDDYQRAGFDSAALGRYGNIVARIKGSRPGKCILFDGQERCCGGIWLCRKAFYSKAWTQLCRTPKTLTILLTQHWVYKAEIYVVL